MSDVAVTLTLPPPAVPVARRRPTGIDIIDETVKELLKDATDISWAHFTHNIVWGCAHRSPACDHCYAESLAIRYGHDVWGEDKPRRVLSDTYWRRPLRWNRIAADMGRQLRVFSSSMADVFEDHPTVAGQRARLWQLIAATPHLDWLLLTKRPENIARMVPAEWMAGAWPANCWIGATMENQRYANIRTRWLRQIPAPVIFASYAPAIGPVVFDLDVIDWVIFEGESGHHARPWHPAWPEDVRDQCVAAGVPFHAKQCGEWGVYPPGWPEPGCMSNRSKAHAVAHDGQHWPEQELAIRYADESEAARAPGDRRFEHVHDTGRRMYRGEFGRPGDLRLHVMHRVGLKHSGRAIDDAEWMQIPRSPALEAA